VNPSAVELGRPAPLATSPEAASEVSLDPSGLQDQGSALLGPLPDTRVMQDMVLCHGPLRDVRKSAPLVLGRDKGKEPVVL
jgi:hypothetical protein